MILIKLYIKITININIYIYNKIILYSKIILYYIYNLGNHFLKIKKYLL